uniref:Hyaluronidase n=1 Tax=Thermobaculum terrenum TaxID=166501 RepID=UPI0006DBD7AB|nr:Chain A, Hyaluronidase [Thermobaculum terrenum]5DIY_B Chain B, Hyaluronidase [Thermobaculum terrenum]
MEYFRYRGIIEGFYGKPWEHQERLDMFEFMQANNLNAYIYAPKQDLYHRELWREPYKEEQLQLFKELIEKAGSCGINFTFAISPGLSLVYSSEEELETLIRKITPFLEMGVHSIGIFFDNVPFDLIHEEDRNSYSNLAEAQADFLTRVLQRLESTISTPQIIMCPTFYCNDPNLEYLRILGQRLPKNIDVFWTGPNVCSHEITTSHMQEVQKSLQRPATLWDNYPVNDGGMMPELHIGPYDHRDPELHTHVVGIYANPMALPEASKLPLYTFAQYLNSPSQYNPQDSWRQAVSTLLGEDNLSAMEKFYQSNTISCLEPEEPAYLTNLFKKVQEDFASFRFEQGLRTLREEIISMQTTYSRLSTQDSKFFWEIRPWLEEYKLWTDYLDQAMITFSNLFTGFFTADEEQARESLQKALQGRTYLREVLKDAVDFRTRVCGDVVRNFLQQVLRSTVSIELQAEGKEWTALPPGIVRD